MYKLEYETTISCGHHLLDSDSLTTKKCLNPHGHNYTIFVTIYSPLLKDGMVIDFGQLKEIIHEYDHKDLNELQIENPTTETIVRLFWSKIKDIMKERLPGSRVEVKIKESEKSNITYYESH